MHVDSGGAAYPCFTFEGNGRFGVEPNESLDKQWLRVQGIRSTLADDACVGEANAVGDANATA
jgi:hypothetical protein